MARPHFAPVQRGRAQLLPPGIHPPRQRLDGQQPPIPVAKDQRIWPRHAGDVAGLPSHVRRSTFDSRLRPMYRHRCVGSEIVRVQVASRFKERAVSRMAIPGEGDQPPGGGDVLPALGEHQPPGRLRRLDTEPEETQRRFGEDHVGDFEGRQHQNRREEIRQQMAENDPAVGGPRSLSRLR